MVGFEAEEVADEAEASFLAFFGVELAGEEVAALDGAGKGLGAVGRDGDDGTGLCGLGVV
jgi:hypothetical protein